jgi:hypothetical protein
MEMFWAVARRQEKANIIKNGSRICRFITYTFKIIKFFIKVQCLKSEGKDELFTGCFLQENGGGKLFYGGGLLASRNTVMAQLCKRSCPLNEKAHIHNREIWNI